MAAEGIYKDRGSKFLGFAEPIKDEDEAKARVAWYKKKYHDARHVCYAYRLGPNLWRTKDDGEPHGTAGAPILRSIDARGLDNILVVVVRYFGGVKLGTSGLIVAYRTAAAAAIEKANIIVKTVDLDIEFTFEYPFMNDVMKVIKDLEPEIISQQFDMDCVMTLRIRKEIMPQLRARLEKVTSLVIKE